MNEMLGLANGEYSIKDLRYFSDSWVGREAPGIIQQACLLWENRESIEKLRRECLEFGPQAVILHNIIPVASLGIYKAVEDCGIPIIQYVHNFRPFSPSGTLWIRGKVNPAALNGNPWPEVWGRGWEKSFFRTFLLALYLKRLKHSKALDAVTMWIAVSEFMRQRFIGAGIDPAKICTLRHCWRPRFAEPTENEGNYYLFLGRIVPEKGIWTLFDAWQILERRLGANCPRLIMAGVGIAEDAIHSRAAQMNRVTCVGYVEGNVKNKLLLGCKGLIAPSIWWEPLGLIVHEAYDAGRPVLAARSGGLSETVIDGVTGYLHEPGDFEGLADDVERLEKNGVLGRRHMGMEGRSWLLREASPEKWRAEFKAILKGVAKV